MFSAVQANPLKLFAANSPTEPFNKAGYAILLPNWYSTSGSGTTSIRAQFPRLPISPAQHQTKLPVRTTVGNDSTLSHEPSTPI